MTEEHKNWPGVAEEVTIKKGAAIGRKPPPTSPPPPALRERQDPAASGSQKVSSDNAGQNGSEGANSGE